MAEVQELMSKHNWYMYFDKIFHDKIWCGNILLWKIQSETVVSVEILYWFQATSLKQYFCDAIIYNGRAYCYSSRLDNMFKDHKILAQKRGQER